MDIVITKNISASQIIPKNGNAVRLGSHFLPVGLKKELFSFLTTLYNMGVCQVKITDLKNICFLCSGKEGVVWKDLSEFFSEYKAKEKEIMFLFEALLYYFSPKFQVVLDPDMGITKSIKCVICEEEHISSTKRIALCKNNLCRSHVLRKFIDPSYRGVA